MSCQAIFLAIGIVVLAEGSKFESQQRSSSNEVTVHGSPSDSTRLHKSQSVHHAGASRYSVALAQQPSSTALVAGPKASESKETSRVFRRVPGKCVGGKLRWWINIKRKCKKAYGEQSRWDRTLLDGWCREAWNVCNTPAYTSCCTQVKGPATMEEYCQENTTETQKDNACKVQGPVKEIQTEISQLPDLIKTMEEPIVEKIVAPAPAPATTLPPATPAPAAVAAGPAATIVPSGMVPSEPEDDDDEEAEVNETDAGDIRQSQCDQVEDIVARVKERIRDLYRKLQELHPIHGSPLLQISSGRESAPVANKDQELIPSNLERHDPELAVQLKRIFKVAAFLLRQDTGSYCHEVDTDDDVDLAINETKLFDLLDWVDAMKWAIRNFETKVHPHGLKWWRYRYEYTVFESFILALAWMLLHFVFMLLHYISSSWARRYHKTGIPHRLYRFASDYFFMHGAAIAVTGTICWVLWEISNIFDRLAEFVRSITANEEMSTPIIGHSYYFLLIAVLFQLFATYMLYMVFLFMIQGSYAKALNAWKLMSGMDLDAGNVVRSNTVARRPSIREDSVRPANLPQGVSKGHASLWTSYRHIMKESVAENEVYQTYFRELGLSFPALSGVTLGDKVEFSLLALLTDALGTSLEFMVEVSLKTNVCLCLIALVNGFLAYYFKLAYVYLMLPQCLMAMALLLAGLGLARWYKYRADRGRDAKTAVDDLLDVHTFCRALQIVLYTLFFSFSRLLLSYDIWAHYFFLGVMGVTCLFLIFVFLYIYASMALQELICMLFMPPHVSNEDFKKALEANVQWRKHPNCHQFGTTNLPFHLSPSIAWSGITKLPPGYDPQSGSFPNSFR